MRKMIVAVMMSMSLTPAGLFAQTAEGRVGTIRISRESLRLAALPQAVRQQQQRVPRERSWPGRHPVLLGALVGLGTGLAVEAAVIPGASGGEPHSAYLPMFSCVGAGIGSFMGLFVSAARR
jgi:anti-sigma factor RsiW